MYLRKLLKKAMRREDVVALGGKRVTIEKLTPAKWRDLFTSIGTIPQLIANVAKAPREDIHLYLMTAAEVGLEDLLNVTSKLSGVEYTYLDNKVNLTDIIEYLVKTYEYNDLDRAVKNVRSLLPMVQK